MKLLSQISRLCLYTWLILFVMPIAQAHHSFGLYDDNAIELEGVVVEVSWRNPHVRITLSVKNQDNTEELWTLEGAASYVLQRRGVDQNLFQPGDSLVVAGRPHTRDSTLMLLSNALLENGKEVLMAGGVEPRWSRDTLGRDGDSQLVDTAAEGRGLFRVWSRAILRPITYGEDLPYREPPLAGGQEWIDRLNGYAQRCEPVGMPGVMATPYPFEFIDQGESIEMRGFSNNARINRTIYLSEDGDFRADRESGSIMGRSLGSWQSENSFVIETTNIDWPYFDDTTGTQLSGNALAREFLTLSEDQSRLDYRMVVDDSSLFSEPVTVIDTYWAALGEPIVYPTECSN